MYHWGERSAILGIESYSHKMLRGNFKQKLTNKLGEATGDLNAMRQTKYKVFEIWQPSSDELKEVLSELKALKKTIFYTVTYFQ